MSQDYMKQALRLARRGMGKTSPNPMVGAVVVKDGAVIGKGYHKKAGEPHAEILALRSARKHAEAHGDIKGASLYVNLEPCCHWGKTPPCTQAIIKSGITEVHASIVDPSSWVKGKGIKELKEAGIKVVIGEHKEEALKLNEAYLKWAQTGIPFVSLKAAITLDGKIADVNRGSKWITNEKSRKFVHRLRSQVDAVIVGTGTVLTDDPELTVRAVRGRSPKRIILDSHLKIPGNAKVLRDGCIVACTDNKKQENAGATIWHIKPDSSGRPDIIEILRYAGQNGIRSILIEGGREIFTEALSRGIVDRVYFFIAPKLLGTGVPVIGDLGITEIKKSLKLTSVEFKKFGDDILVTGDPPEATVRAFN
jgi:diaminohydroxyphosphoribosylaminopyrimidine deaminase/5-amino-6-(5-phosphoribosylamino)uracil reductase